MKKGIFAQRKINSNLRINKLETKREDLGEKLSLSEPPWHERYRNLSSVQSNEDSSGIDYFLKVNDNHERLIEPIDCVPNELTIFVDNELQRAENTNTLIRRKLWENLESSKDDALVRCN